MLDRFEFRIEDFKIKKDGLNRKKVVDLFSILNNQIGKNALNYEMLLRKTLKITGFEKGRILELKQDRSMINEIYTDSIIEESDERVIKNYMIDDINYFSESCIKDNFIYIENISEIEGDSELAGLTKIAEEFSFKSVLCYPIIDEVQELIGFVCLTSNRRNDIGYADLFNINYIVGLLRNNISLNMAKERYRLAFDNEFTGFMILDDQGFIIDVNARCSEIFEYEIDEMVGKSYKYFLTEESFAKVKYNFENRIKNSNIEKNYEITIKSKLNLTKTINISVALLKNRHKRIIKIEDITEKLLLNEKKNSLLKKYQTLFEDSKSIMLMIDPEDGKILDANKKALDFYGYDYNKIISMKINDINTLSKIEIKNEKNLALKEEREFFKFKHKLADDTMKNVEVYTGSIDYEGKKVLYSTITDTTKRFEFKEKLNEKNKYEIALNKIQKRLETNHKSYEKIWNIIRENCKIDAFRIIVHQKENYQDSINFMSDNNPNPDVIGKYTFYGDEIVEMWSKLLNEHYILDIDTKDLLESNKELLFYDKNLIKSLIAIPILKDEKVYASIFFEIYKGRNDWSSQERRLLKTIIRILKLDYELNLREKKIEHQLTNTIKIISSMLKSKDPYTYEHQKNVMHLSKAIAKEMNLSEERIQSIGYASLLHDMGKINIPTEILNKSGKISDLEYKLIKEHVKFSFELVKKIDFHKPIAKMVYQHHERLDGSGYPEGIEADEILLESKILSVADVFDAMSNDRPYRKGYDIERVLEELNNNVGVKYDSNVVEALTRVLEYDKIRLVESSQTSNK